jgi:uncharacterized lipoprotein YajG
MNSRTSASSLVMLAAVALLCGCVAQPPHAAYVAAVETSCYVSKPDARPVSIETARRLLTECRTGARRSYLPWQIERMFR